MIEKEKVPWWMRRDKPVFKVIYPCGCDYEIDWNEPYDSPGVLFCKEHEAERVKFVNEHWKEIFGKEKGEQ